MDYIQLTMDDYIQCKTEIKENLCGIVKSFVRVGWQLTRINNSEAYKLDGYSSIAEFAKAEYDMNPDGVSRFMGVYERYSIPGDTPELKEQYRDFKFAQLSEMLQLSAEDQAMIQPETKRSDIRELKKFNRENENNPEGLLNWKGGQQDKLHETILEFYKASKEILNDLYSSEAYQDGNIRRMAEIVNPSGNRSFRKGTVFLMMYGYDKGIMVKQIPQGTSNMTWEEFFSITQEIFAEAAAGGRTYDNYFGPESQKTAPGEETSRAPEDTGAETEFAPAQKPDKKEEKSQETAQQKPETQENAQKGPEQKPNMPEETEQTEAEEDQISGQDTIMNHPEYMPGAADPEATEPPKEGPLHGKRFEKCIYMQDTDCIADDCKGCTRKREFDKAAREKKKEEIAPAQAEPKRQQAEQKNKEKKVPGKPATRKEYIDSLTLTGTAEYLAEAMGSFDKTPWNEMQEPHFWEEWLNGKVDHAGKPWVD